MSKLFSNGWMNELGNKWNATPHIVDPLKKAEFTANIAYGFKGEEKPRGVIVITNGVITHAGDYADEALDWDLRASPENWQNWIEKGFGLARLGPAVATKALEFTTGNYRQMIRNPSLSHPFLEHFKLMQELHTDF